MLIAYVENAEHTYYHTAWVDGFYLAQKGGDIFFRETQQVYKESVYDHNRGDVVTIEHNPPKVEITSEHRVADWFEVPADQVKAKHVYHIDLIAHHRSVAA